MNRRAVGLVSDFVGGTKGLSFGVLQFHLPNHEDSRSRRADSLKD